MSILATYLAASLAALPAARQDDSNSTLNLQVRFENPEGGSIDAEDAIGPEAHALGSAGALYIGSAADLPQHVLALDRWDLLGGGRRRGDTLYVPVAPAGRHAVAVRVPVGDPECGIRELRIGYNIDERRAEITIPIGTGTLKGSVRSDTGEPVAGLAVAMLPIARFGSESGLGRSWYESWCVVKTDSEGQYAFSSMPPGMYAVVADVRFDFDAALSPSTLPRLASFAVEPDSIIFTSVPAHPVTWRGKDAELDPFVAAACTAAVRVEASAELRREILGIVVEPSSDMFGFTESMYLRGKWTHERMRGPAAGAAPKDDGWEAERLPAGKARIRLRREGAIDLLVEATVSATKRETVRLDVPLAAALGTLSGRIDGWDSIPVEKGAARTGDAALPRVLFRIDVTRLDASEGPATPSRFPHPVQRDGTFSLRGLPVGAYRIEVGWSVSVPPLDNPADLEPDGLLRMEERRRELHEQMLGWSFSEESVRLSGQERKEIAPKAVKR